MSRLFELIRPLPQLRVMMVTSHADALCEQSEFRAANTIFDLVEGYDVTVAKKIHMWGAGL